MDRGSGEIRLPGARFELAFDGVASDRLIRAAERLSRDVARRTGLAQDAGSTTVRVQCHAPGGAVPDLAEDESYWLVADDAGLYLDAASEWGALRGLVTLGQLVTGEGTVPHVAVDDRPRFSWRGLLLDPARHFLPVHDLLRTVEGMARCKLNVLHLHLSDDQGFRFPVPAFPRLASAESYTADELASVVRAAADLGIRVVPEIDMPGHVTSWLTAYPEWGSRQVGAASRFGVHPACLDPSNEAVFEAIGAILDALVAVFPDPCLHIGGDEVSPGWWSEDPSVGELMRREALSDVSAVQCYFNRRVADLATARRRQVVAWDEVLGGADAGEDWIIQAWRGSTMRDRALAAGKRVVVSAPYYLDLNYPLDVHYGFDPAAPQADLLAREDALLADDRFAHVAEGMRWTLRWRDGALERGSAAHEERLLGAEACLWGELVTPAVLDTRLWTRLPAVAERFWSAPEAADMGTIAMREARFEARDLPLAGIDLAARLTTELDRLGVDGDWRELVDMLEPVKWYGRLLGEQALAARIEGREMPQARPYDVHSALNDLVDHLPVESRRAGTVAALCERHAAGDPDARDALDRTVAGWQELAAHASDAPRNLQPLAEKLGRLADLVADRLADRPAAPEVLEAVSAPVGELMLAIPPALRRWLRAG